MVASLEHQQALVSNKKTDTSNYRAFPGERLTGEWPPGTRPYVSDQMLWFRSSGFYNLDPLAVADASPRARDKTGAVRGDDAHVRPWTTANSRPAPPSTPKDVRGPAAFADMEKPPHQMEGYWRRAAELSARLERGPKHEGWGTGLLPHRPKNFASELRGKTSRPISNAEKLNWSPRASTPRHQPLAKPQDRCAQQHAAAAASTRAAAARTRTIEPICPIPKCPVDLTPVIHPMCPAATCRLPLPCGSDPMWGVSKSLVADESRTSGFSAVNSFMTTNEQFHGHAGWYAIGLQPPTSYGRPIVPCAAALFRCPAYDAHPEVRRIEAPRAPQAS